jgi:hypothetical protein
MLARVQVRRRLSRAGVALLALALVTTPVRRARAEGLNDLFAVAVATTVVGLVVVGAGVTFTVHDGLAVSKPPPASQGWSAAETAIATPVAVGLDVVTAWILRRPDPPPDEATVLLMVPSIWTNALATHGIWGLAAPQSDTRLLMGGSWAVGANLVFTLGAAVTATHPRRLPGMVFGALEMIGTAPTLAVGVYELASPDRPYKATFAALTAWSGLLFVHGVASLAVGIKERRAQEAKERPAAWAPARLRLAIAPTVLTGGPAPARALVLGGTF